MKILVISHMYPSSFNEVGGIFVHEQVKALVAKGVKIQVVSPIPWTPFPINYLSSKWKKYSEVTKREIREGINVWYPRYLTFPRAWFFASSGQRMYGGIKDVVSKIYKEFQFDLIHAHVALPDGYAGMKISKEFNVSYVVTIHGQDFYITINKNNKCKAFIKKVLKNAGKVIVVSNELKKIAVNSFGDTKNIKVIGNGVPSNKIINIKKLSYKTEKNKKVLISVSYLIKRKGITYNLRAFAKLVNKYQNLKYIIIGNGSERKYLENLSKELGITDKVEFLGMLSHDDAIKKMAEADIFSLPSWDEAFGVVYVEAMAQGKPVIGCQGEGIEDFVENGKTGLLVKPRDVDSLLKAMDYLLSNPDEARAIGKRARKLVLENYTWEKNAEKTIEIYNQALNDVH